MSPKAKKIAIRAALMSIPFWQRILLTTYLSITRILPTKLVLFLVRRASRNNPEENFERADERVAQNLPTRPEGKLYWLNSIGPGDSTATQALLSKILKKDRSSTVLITTRTVSAQGIFSRWKDNHRVIIQLAPHDGLSIVRNFLNHWRPAIAVFCERDLWPNMLRELNCRNTPVAVVNGQLDGRLIEDFGILQQVGRWLLMHIDLIHSVTTNSQSLAESYFRTDAIKIYGNNLKLDCDPLPTKKDVYDQLISKWGQFSIFTAASVTTGEVKTVLEAFRLAQAENENLRLILVPRWKSQSDDFHRIAVELGYIAPRRSKEGLPEKTDQIFIADSYGELGTWYEASYSSFIGDTFNGGAGHNAYEAILKGIPVVAGGIGRLFQDDFIKLIEAGVCEITPDKYELAQAMKLTNTDIQKKKIKKFMSNQGISDKITEKIFKLSSTDKALLKTSLKEITK